MNNKEAKFHIINLFVFVIIIIIEPFIGILLGVIQYSPTGSADNYFWINPFLDLIPLTYLIISLYFLFNKKFTRVIVLLFMSYSILKSQILTHGKKEIIADYHTLFSKIGLTKK